MILVDSSVWIDYLANHSTREADWLDKALGSIPIAIGDLMIAEVLQGCDTDYNFRETWAELATYKIVQISDKEVALAAAEYYRRLRSLGITVRKTIDTLIATRCILDDIPLLYSDRDFRPFVEHLSLRSALDDLESFR